MPLTPSLPTWGAWNNANFTSPTGLTDGATGQPVAAGGLNLGEYFDATNQDAANASYNTNGILYGGRYRLVQVDSGATAANVRTGTIGYLRQGGTGAVKSAVIAVAGTGATYGTYTIAATAGTGGGSGAVIQVVVGTNGFIIGVSVLNGGYGYSSAPTFSLTGTNTTGGVIIGQLDTGVNIVTSADQTISAVPTAIPVRPVVFLNSVTPGNYGFIQELGVATVVNAAATTQVAGQFANVTTTTGVMAASGTTLGLGTIGNVIDPLPNTAPVNTPFKVLLGYAFSPVQD
jgi:hypothetical protein